MDADVVEPAGIGDLGGLFAAVALFRRTNIVRHCP